MPEQPSEPMTVIAATDFSAAARAAVERAARIAEAHQGRLLLVHAFDEARWKNLRSLFAPRRRLLAGQPVQQAWKSVRAAAARISRARDVACTGVVVLGRAARALAAKAQEARAALLVLGPHGRRFGDRLYLGSTALGLARLAPCPVLVARRRPALPYRRCLAGFDFSPASLRAVQAAARLFPAVEFTLLHAVQPAAAPLRLDAGLRSALLREAEVRLARAVETGAPAAASRRVAMGPAHLVLKRALSAGRFDLVALGRHAGSALGERVLGSVPANVLVNARADVLISP
ncbi:MAG: universal stress protein [Burkholderiales bacterium]|nr:universal stress protein [Burkholderiales bacterium]